MGKILDSYSIDRLETGYFCSEKIGFLGKILDSYSIDRLETGYFCSEKIGFLGKILDSYSIDRLETEYFCSEIGLTNSGGVLPPAIRVEACADAGIASRLPALSRATL